MYTVSGYVQNFATIARPLHRLADSGQPYVWDDPCAQAFNALQTALITAPVLAYPDGRRTGHSSCTRMPATWALAPSCLSQVTAESRFSLSSRQHSNADALSRRPCAAAGCKHCPRQEARAQLAPTVATLRTVDGEAGCLPLSPTQVQEAQECDAALAHPEVEGGPKIDYLHRLQERLQVAYDFTRQAQAGSGVKQKRHLVPGPIVHTRSLQIFCPSRTKGVSPKLRSKCSV
ncbi:hypothetical protein AAFF_G00302060 [Aldrovandia affinis]|uniref:Reverse transcriptase/retrotransposon-derived protein RNase H-like domain-containing protein n=1 Tax=Aldrovandia affinis TaxID=143900 RepID=A0AAD7WRJ2_9TELE|nr:hypothetical protein AAFF_G00302060 [Aldrovandia affinis]